MGYDVTIRREDGTEVPVAVKPTKIKVDTGDTGLSVGLAWCKPDIQDDPTAYAALLGAWPQVDGLVLAKDDAARFDGLVSCVGHDEKHVWVEAVGDGGGPQPGALSLSVSADDADPNRMTVSVVVDNAGEGEVSLDFGDGSPTEVNAGDGATATVHTFADEGQYAIQATDTDQPERTATESVTVPFPGEGEELVVTITADPSDPNRLTASLVANNAGQGEVSVDWGDGSATEVNPGDGATPSTHVYVDGSYQVAVTDTDQPERTVSQPITVPFPAQ